MKKLLIITLSLLPIISMAQAKTKKIVNTENPGYNEEYYVIKKTDTKHGEYKKLTKKNNVAFEKGFYKDGKRDGKWTIKLQGLSPINSTGSYAEGKKVGLWTYNYENKVDQIYDHTNNKVVTSKREKGQLDYIGGKTLIRTFIEENLVYNESARKRGIRGKVYVSFNVNDKGEVHNIRVTKGVHELLDVEAKRVISLIPSMWITPIPAGAEFEWVINFGG